MAENKKSFLLYCDMIHCFDGLTDEEAGKLAKHLFRYVNDMNPKAPDRLTEVMFEPIKHKLKEALAKWEESKRKRAEAGSKGGKQTAAKSSIAKQNEANASNPQANQAVTVTDTVVPKGTLSLGEEITPAGNFEPLNNPDQIEVKAYIDESQFLEDWKEARMHYDKKPTEIRKLDMRERSVFQVINKEYKQDQIRAAIKGLFMQKNMFPATRLRPSHFLENIEKYLDCQRNNIQLFDDGKKKKEDRL